MQATRFFLQQQRGAALIMALSILLVLTILGISAMSTTALQERMAGNARDYEVAFAAAETGLNAAETYLANMPNTSEFSPAGGSNGGGKFSASTTTSEWMTSSNWTDTAVGTRCYQLPTGTFAMSVAQQPRYIIQQLNATVTAGAATQASLEPISYTNNPPLIGGGAQVYQVTARGYGLSATSRVMLQSYYAK
ncbi:MAG: hypothetical protein HY080_01110 [Gammaproteobacteria bacterium]|nr:hypothetical protein [Gammaproteobacteria bacterium]